MKISAYANQPLLLVAGGATVLLIGALAKFDPGTEPIVPTDVPAVASDDAANDFYLPTDFPAALGEVITLSRAGVREDVIMAYVRNSGERYAPTADQLIYLRRAGVSQNVMAAFYAPKAPESVAPPAEIVSAAPSEPVAQEPPGVAVAEPVSIPSAGPAPAPASSGAAFFHDDLAPYGDWVQTPEYGWAWQPGVEQTNPQWQPYRDGGNWLYTDAGWYWQSQYPWGWAAFHYGGWWRDAARGWLWAPGQTWSPRRNFCGARRIHSFGSGCLRCRLE